MSHIYLIAYIVVGLFTAIGTMRVFPPMEGFRPGLALRLLALVVFVTLWPVLISLAVWYYAMGYFGRKRESPTKISKVEFVAADRIRPLQGSKPR